VPVRRGAARRSTVLARTDRVWWASVVGAGARVGRPTARDWIGLGEGFVTADSPDMTRATPAQIGSVTHEVG